MESALALMFLQKAPSAIVNQTGRRMDPSCVRPIPVWCPRTSAKEI